MECNKITYHVVHVEHHIERLDNIMRNECKLGKQVHFFNAINASTVDVSDLKVFDPELKKNFDYYYIGEIGCYLSHFMLLKSLAKSTLGYSVIFEDDFSIIPDDLHERINHFISTIETSFDMIYLGNTKDNHGHNYKEDIFHIDPSRELWGTHAYVVNNKSIDKICNALLTMDCQIDVKYKTLFDNGTLNGLVIYPVLVNQSDELKTSICL